MSDYVTHKYSSLDDLNTLVEQLHQGACLRGVVQINEYPLQSHLALQVQSRQAHFGGQMIRATHFSQANACKMTFSVFLPSSAVHSAQKVPVVFFLAGLTSTDENARTKSMISLYASQHQIAIVFPDTSPRDVSTSIPQLDSFSWEVGYGAGFYVNATKAPFSKHFNMFSYIDQELPSLVGEMFPVDMSRKSITGFSMGGHGAMVCYLRNPSAYKSVSAFSPIVNPTQSGFGQKNFQLYFQEPAIEGPAYDTLCLLRSLSQEQKQALELLVDQGSHDIYEKEELQLAKLQDLVSKENMNKVKVTFHSDYDHSYFFVASFAQKHMDYHAKRLL